MPAAAAAAAANAAGTAAASSASSGGMAPEGARAVTAEDNLFDQKSHANPLARLMEIVANSVEHGAASRVALEFRHGFFAATETDGKGLDYEGLVGAMGRFGGHQARTDGEVRLAGFSHNGIGTKSPMSIFTHQLVLSRTGPTHAVALLSRGHGPHVLGGQWDSAAALARGAAGATAPRVAPAAVVAMVGEILKRAAPMIPNVLGEFAKIGGRGGCRWIYFTDPGAPRPAFGVGDAVDAEFSNGFPYSARVDQVISRASSKVRKRAF